MRLTMTRIVMCLFVAVVTNALCVQRARATPFVSELVDTSGNTGAFPSIAIGGDGAQHIAYLDQTRGDMCYAHRKAGSEWVLEVVDTAGNVGVGCRMALDGDGIPWIVYVDQSNHSLKVANRTSGRWASNVVDNSGSVGMRTALAIDPRGTVHVVYVKLDNLVLRYLYLARGAAWSPSEMITSVGSPAFSLAVDGAGAPQVAFRSGTSVVLSSRDHELGQWGIPQVVRTLSDHPSMVLTGAGVPFIAHTTTGSSRVLNVSTKQTSGVWTAQAVETVVGSSVLEGPDLSVGPGGSLAVAYRDTTAHVLKYASNITGVWLPEAVIQSGNPGAPSLVVDRFGNPAIACFDSSDTGLRLTQSGIRLLAPLGQESWAWGGQYRVEWSGVGPVDVELSVNGGRDYTALASGVGGGGLLVVAPSVTTSQARIRVVRQSPFAMDESPGTFVIAQDSADPWWTEIADSVGQTGSFGSLALDSHDAPRMTHFSGAAGRLRYSARYGSRWVHENVNAAGFGGFYGSLALSSDGTAHVSYYDQMSGHQDLRYARRAGGAWSDTLLEAAGTTGLRTSLALDRAGEPSISYYDQSGQRLRFCSRATGAWIFETIDQLGRGASSLGVDGLGRAHVSYYSSTGLRYAVRTPTVGWSVPLLLDASTSTAGGASSLALDRNGEPHIAYTRSQAGVGVSLLFAERRGLVWYFEVVQREGYGGGVALKVEEDGTPHLCYAMDDGSLVHAYRRAGVWLREVAVPVDVRTYHSITGSIVMVLDGQGNPRIAFQDGSAADLMYCSRAIEVREPFAASSWPVGARRTVQWSGSGAVGVDLSVDAGLTWQTLATEIMSGQYRLTVPNTVSNFCKVRVRRSAPASIAVSDSTFAISGSVALVSFEAELGEDGAPGVVASWRTSPALEDLAGYTLRVRRASGAQEVLGHAVRAMSLVDPRGGVGDRYELAAVNGLGEATSLGSVVVSVGMELAMGPNPAGDRGVEILYTSTGSSPLELAVFDIAGRKLVSLAAGVVAPGTYRTSWSPRRGAGRKEAGVYFVRLRQGGQERIARMVAL